VRAEAATLSWQSKLNSFVRRPRVTLYLLAGWSLLAGITQLFVNSGLFLDIHGAELDGALGGLALSFNAVPLSLLYFYCSRDPDKYHAVFWLALVHQAAMVLGNLYHLIIGTFSAESVILPILGAGALASLSFAQVFEPRSQPPVAQLPAGTSNPADGSGSQRS
jgi:hypothetical protein